MLADMSRWCALMATLVESGVSLTRSLSAAEEEFMGMPLGTATASARNGVDGGRPLSSALSLNHFDRFLVEMVRSGELNATLDKTLREAAEQFRGEALLEKKGAVRQMMLFRWAGRLGRLLPNGVPILQSLDTVAETMSDEEWSSATRKVREQIREGKNFLPSLQEMPHLFPPYFAALVDAGEKHGYLDENLRRAADYILGYAELSGR